MLQRITNTYKICGYKYFRTDCY